MTTHYNAFISYKHEANDIEVAKAVHHGLEFYHIPGKLRKEYGKKRINKVFRDKDELGLTHNLTDTIYQALDNSDHLIVICSTETKKSVWVEKEIEYFLKNHDRKDVFTVLVNGEPEEVIPDILLHEKTEITDSDGNTHTVEKTAELISCDYRIPPKKAKKEELPRLISAMIGCSYSELVNRRKMHAIRQLSAIMALLLFFSALITASLIRNAKLIKQNYIKALQDQSVQLSEAASDLLKNGDRVSAILMALKALPNDKNSDMPVTAEAVKTLIDTTYAYKTPDSDTFDVMWNYSTSNFILYMVLSDDESKLAATGSRGNVIIWDTKTHEVLLDTHAGNYFSIPIFLPDNRIFLLSDERAVVFDIESGSELYSIQPEKGLIPDNTVHITDDNSIYIFSRFGQLYEYSLEDGSLLNSYEFNHSDEEISTVKISENGKMIAYTTITESYETKVHVYDITTKESSLIIKTACEIQNLFWVDNNLLMYSELEPQESRNFYYSNDEYTISENRTDIHCYDAKKKSEAWCKSLSYNYPMLTEGFLKPEDTNAVSYYIGNSLVIYNYKTGKEINSCDLGDTISSVCDAGNGTLHCYTKKGGFSTVSAKEKEVSNTVNVLFPQGVENAVITQNGIYMTHDDQTSIVYYESGAHDDAIAFFEQGPKIKYSSTNYMADDLLITIYDDEDCSKLCTYDLDDYETFTVTELLDGQTEESMQIIGLYDGIIYASYAKLDTYETYSSLSYFVSDETMYSINYKTGEINPLDLPGVSGENISLDASVLCGNELVYPVSDEENETGSIMILNLDTGEARELSCPYAVVSTLDKLRYSKESQIIFCFGNEDCIIDTENNEINEIAYPDDWSYSYIVSDIENGLIYISSPDEVVVVDKTGTIIHNFSKPGCMPQGTCRIETANGSDEFLVLYDGFICRYDAKSGKELGEFSTSSYYLNQPMLYYDKKSQHLIISKNSHSFIIDTKEWIEIANILNSYGYDQSNDRFLIFYRDDGEYGRVGYFDRYTTDELIQKAHDITGDEQLSEEDKVTYSVED